MKKNKCTRLLAKKHACLANKKTMCIFKTFKIQQKALDCDRDSFSFQDVFLSSASCNTVAPISDEKLKSTR
jgi:hypothetical protein